MFRLDQPLWMGLLPLLALALVALLRRRADAEAAQLPVWRRRLSLGLRLVTLSLLLLALAGLRYRLPQDEVCITFLVDRSHSARRYQRHFQDFLELALSQRPPQVRVAVVYFGGESSLELPPTLKPYVPRPTRNLDPDQSDLAGALQFAAAAFPPGMGGRVVLLSDGRETRGSLTQAAEALSAMGLELDTLIPPAPREPEVVLEELRVPSSVARHTPFDLWVTVYSTVACPKAELRVVRRGRQVGRFGIELQAGRNVFLLPQPGPTEAGGTVGYEVQLVAPQDGERANNKARALTLVEGPGRVALLSKGRSSQNLASLLRQQGLLVDLLGPGQLPEEVGEWLGYQAVVLDDISATEFSSDQLEALPALVREAGLGLVMLGGVDSFAAGGYSQTPLAEALPLDLRIQRQRLTPPTAQVHVIDKSGSMSQVTRGVEHMALAREASIGSMELLTSEDHFGVVAFDDAAKWVVPLQPLARPRALAGAIGSMRAGGGTDLYPALNQALAALLHSPLSSRHVLVLSDGATSPADFDRLMALAVREKITVSTVAVGEGADQVFLERLARQGKGRAYVADQAQALPRIFARETMLNARSAFDERPTGVRLQEAHPVTTGLELSNLPPLLGHNLATARGAPHRVLLQTSSGDPLLATGRYGLGKVVAFTGDSGRRWCQAWSQRSDFAQLLTAMVRWSLPSVGGQGLEVSSQLDAQQRLRVRARLTVDGATAGLRATLIHPDGSRRDLDLLQVAPDLYEASAESRGEGTAVLVVATADGLRRQMLPVALGHSQELAGVEVQQGLLTEAARLGGGRSSPQAPEVFRRPARLPDSYRELRPKLLQLALLLLLVEVAVRRLPWPAKGRPRSSPPPPSEEVSLAGSLRHKVKRPSQPRARIQVEEVAAPQQPSPSPSSAGDALEGLRRVKRRRPPAE